MKPEARTADGTHYLSVCAIFRDEAPYLEEWVQFHLQQGVDHFYLYDNDSRDKPAQTLEPYIRKGRVTLRPWSMPYKPGQLRAYADCLERDRESSRWIAFIDIDEFLFAPAHDLPTLLSGYERFGGLVVNWQIYGSSGHERGPRGGVVGRFVHKAPERWIRNQQFKSIVNPRLVTAPRTSHQFDYVAPHFAVDETGRKAAVTEVNEPWRRLRQIGRRFLRPIHWQIAVRFPLSTNPLGSDLLDRVRVDRIRINHYMVRSRDEFEDKRRRHPASQSRRYNNRYFAYFDRNEVHDPIAAVRAGLQPVAAARRPSAE